MTTSRRTIRWIIAHYPVHLFLRTAEKFRAELEKACPGEFELEVYSMNSYANAHDGYGEFRLIPPDLSGLEHVDKEFTAMDGKLTKLITVKEWGDIKKKWNKLFDGLRDGDFEISQTQVSLIGAHLDPTFHTIDLPFLFEDHDHVSRVLDGEIGDSIMSGMAEKTGIRGLAFTYSGGYRVIGSKQGITNLVELAKANLLAHTAHSNSLFSNVGAKVVEKGISKVHDLADIANDDNGAIETTYIRFSGKHVLKTEHSMFTTTILTGTKFFDSLTPKQQQAFLEVSKIVARAEREWSVQDAEKYEADAQKNGVTIVAVSDEDKRVLKTASRSAYHINHLNQLGIDPKMVKQIIDKGTLH
jgi:TRAP-type C4-dicarboxylate transport system substrate-binding protein